MQTQTGLTAEQVAAVLERMTADDSGYYCAYPTHNYGDAQHVVITADDRHYGAIVCAQTMADELNKELLNATTRHRTDPIPAH